MKSKNVRRYRSINFNGKQVHYEFNAPPNTKKEFEEALQEIIKTAYKKFSKNEPL